MANLDLDVKTIAKHLTQCGKRAALVIWATDDGFAARVNYSDQKTIAERVLPSSPVVFDADIPDVVSLVAGFCRSLKKDQTDGD